MNDFHSMLTSSEIIHLLSLNGKVKIFYERRYFGWR